MLDHEGHPADANVYLGTAARPWWVLPVSTRADENGGRITVAGIPPGALKIRVVALGVSVWGRAGGDTFDPAPDEELTLRLPAPESD